jgi:glycosyltransferase involved in cell wall biosynthesis
LNIPVSVLVLTRNEQQDLPACLESVAWSDDVHVYDSFSSDATPDIARAHGASVTQRGFDGYASQRNAALSGLPFRHAWVLILDADERVPPALRDELARTVAAAPEVAAFRIRRRDFFMGRWLKHAQISPFYVRLVRPPQVHYEREINEVLCVDGSVGELTEPFDHFPFSKGVAHWVAKHNVYSSMEAELIAAGASGPARLADALFERDFHRRRVAQKAIFYRLPWRPLVKWLYMMFVRGAVLDGRAGIAYAFLQAFYEYLIVLKTAEIRSR